MNGKINFKKRHFIMKKLILDTILYNEADI